MLFNSLPFLCFFLVIHQAYWRFPQKWRKYWLLLASLFFYGWWDWRFLVHFAFIVVFSHVALHSLLANRRKWVFVATICVLLFNLAFFKYTSSILLHLGEMTGADSLLALRDRMGLVLPLAISFYTFQIVAFVVDTWRGEVEEISFVDYSLFIMFFPQLISGPIMRHRDFLSQIDHVELREKDTFTGLYLVMLGLVKKVLIADELGYLVNPVWANPDAFHGFAIFLATAGFTAQVYCDFSGYTDMARGLAKLLGYSIPENFYAPFLATHFTDFWRRWHVTLSTWLRDYLYFPLGGSRVPPLRAMMNTIIVMSLGGLWHGNTYTFFLWGLVHGIFLILEKVLRQDKPAKTIPGAVLKNTILMLGMFAGAVFFRAPDMGIVTDVFTGVFRLTGEGVDSAHIIQLYLVMLGLQAVKMKWPKFEKSFEGNRRWLLVVFAVILFYWIARIEHPVEDYIYFQF